MEPSISGLRCQAVQERREKRAAPRSPRLGKGQGRQRTRGHSDTAGVWMLVSQQLPLGEVIDPHRDKPSKRLEAEISPLAGSRLLPKANNSVIYTQHRGRKHCFCTRAGYQRGLRDPGGKGISIHRGCDSSGQNLSKCPQGPGPGLGTHHRHRRMQQSPVLAGKQMIHT